MSDDIHSLLGQTIGHIRVVDVLGQGGMGAVYVGFDDTLQRKVAFGPEHVNTVQVLEDLAGLHNDWGRPEAAVPYLLRVLAIRERANGPHHPEVADTAETLAAAYSAAGQAAQAQEMEQRAAAIRATIE